MASYPTSIYPAGTNTDGDLIDADYMNVRDNELNAIELALGKDLVPATGKLVDRVQVGPAPSFDLFLAESGGKVGVGTSTPSALLHVDDGGTIPSLFTDTVGVFQKGSGGAGTRVSIFAGPTGKAILDLGDDTS